MANPQKRIVVLGAGFGGLTFCQALRHPDARITLVDRNNHHLFQPLLYQVATAGLSAPEIAEPIRSILSDHPNVEVLMDTVNTVDVSARVVRCEKATLPYDCLVVALGGVTSYFGHPEWEAHAPGLKTLSDALRIRNEVLLAFEKAETETDPARRDQLMTLVVVGGGPTGVELAGAFAELALHVLRRDFRRIDASKARVILIEAGPRLLGHLPERLSHRAAEQLRQFGVEVRTEQRVAEIRAGEVRLVGGEVISAENIIWAAGVSGNPVAASLPAERDRAGRIKVSPDLSLPGHPEVFVVGDLAAVTSPDGTPVPGVSPAAMQMARHAARIIRTELTSQAAFTPAAARPAFRYFDKGTMATIGRSAAVAKVGWFECGGFVAWLLWLFVHLLFLIGFDNKLTVLTQWAHSYFTYKRGARLIIPGNSAPSSTPSRSVS